MVSAVLQVLPDLYWSEYGSYPLDLILLLGPVFKLCSFNLVVLSNNINPLYDADEARCNGMPNEGNYQVQKQLPASNGTETDLRMVNTKYLIFCLFRKLIVFIYMVNACMENSSYFSISSII